MQVRIYTMMRHADLSFFLCVVLASASLETESLIRTNLPTHLDKLLDNHTRDGIPPGVVCNETRWQVAMHGKDETRALSQHVHSMSQV